MKKLKFPFMLLAVCIALAASFAFNLPGKTDKEFTVYHYTSDSQILDDLQDIGNWQGSDASCPSEGDVPCAMTNNGTGTFQEYLDSFTDAGVLISAANTKRTVVK